MDALKDHIKILQGMALGSDTDGGIWLVADTTALHF